MPRPRANCLLAIATAAGVISFADGFMLSPHARFSLSTPHAQCAVTPPTSSHSKHGPLYLGMSAGGDDPQEVTGNDEEEAWVVTRRPGRLSPHLSERWRRLQRSFLHGAISLAAFTFGATALSEGLRKGAGVELPWTIQPAEASLFKKFSKRTIQEKLANIPVFMVVNKGGSPYLTPAGEGSSLQLANFFTNLDDAKEMLMEMVQTPFYLSDARILVLGFDKAYDMVKQGPRSTGMDPDGDEDYMAFKFFQDHAGLEKARELGLSGFEGTKASKTIPVFYAEGLEVKRDGEKVKPLFMDPEDLVSAWKKAAEKNKDMPARPNIKVFSLPEVIIQMEASDDYAGFGIFPSEAAMKYVKDARSKVPTKARLRRMQAF